VKNDIYSLRFVRNFHHFVFHHCDLVKSQSLEHSYIVRDQIKAGIDGEQSVEICMQIDRTWSEYRCNADGAVKLTIRVVICTAQ